jgi:hypothetical protein
MQQFGDRTLGESGHFGWLSLQSSYVQHSLGTTLVRTQIVVDVELTLRIQRHRVDIRRCSKRRGTLERYPVHPRGWAKYDCQ